MPMVICPTCKKSDQVPDKFIGARLKCKKCGTSILVTAQGAELIPTPAPAATTATASVSAVALKPAKAAQPSGIEVEGLDQSAWTTISEPPPAEPEPPRHDHVEHPIAAHAPHAVDGPSSCEHPKEYKLLTPKDKWFGGKFELARLEDALNYYARQGWVVRSMATPQVAGFSGGPREELVVLLER
jgi:hypothetical protein